MVLNVSCSGNVLASLDSVGLELFIGRDKKKCKIVLAPDAVGVSRVHAKLKWSSDKTAEVVDSSTYGTLVNGVLVKNGGKAIADGGTFTIGEKQFKVEIVPELKINVGSSSMSSSFQPLTQSSRLHEFGKKNASLIGSQRNMSDFFSSSKVGPSQILAPESQFSVPDPIGVDKCDFGSSIVESSQSSVAEKEVIPTISRFMDDDDFADVTVSSMSRQVKKRKEKPKASLFSNQTVLAEDTLDFVPKIPRLSVDEAVDDSQKSVDLKPMKISPVMEESALFDPGCNDQPSFNDLGTTWNNETLRTQRVTNSSDPFSLSNLVKKAPGRKRSALFPVPDGKQIPNPSVTGPVAKKPALEKPQNATNGFDIFGSICDVDPVKDTTKAPKRAVRNTRAKKDENHEELDEHSLLKDQSLIAAVSSGKEYEIEPSQTIHGVPVKNKAIKEEDVELVVKKLCKMIIYSDLCRTNQTMEDCTGVGSVSMDCSDVSNKPNFKKFKKASQGKFNNSVASVSVTIGGSADFVDFRKLR